MSPNLFLFLACLALPGCSRDPIGSPGNDAAATDAGDGSNVPTSASASTTEDPVAGDCVEEVQSPGGAPSGLLRCSGGEFDRRGPETCEPSTELPQERDDCSSCTKFGGGGVCRRDGNESFCHYDCRTDADCGPEAACVCASQGLHPYNQCVSAGCASAEDCSSGACGVSLGDCGRATSLQCRRSDDLCRSDDDCPNGEDPNALSCVFHGHVDRFACISFAECM